MQKRRLIRICLTGKHQTNTFIMSWVIFATGVLIFSLSAVGTVQPEPSNLQFECINGQNVLIWLRSTTSQVLKASYNLQWTDREDRLNGLTEILRSNAAVSQRRVLEFLSHHPDAHTWQIKSFWISNVISLSNVDCSVINRLGATFKEIQSITLAAEFRQESLQHVPDFPKRMAESSEAIGWAIWHMDVYDAWNYPGENTSGEGIVVGSIDAGVDNYDLLVNHRSSYGWYDSYSNSLELNDQSGRGTVNTLVARVVMYFIHSVLIKQFQHSTGTVLGEDGIGVAPGAQWIACKACGRSVCSEMALLECGQWMACPTHANGTEPDCTKSPHVVINTWAAGQGKSFFDEVIQVWRALDIVPVAGTGDFGPSCGTMTTPGDRPGVISVGATNQADELSYISSKGPRTHDFGTPTLAAPGVNIFSTWNGDGGLVGKTTTGTHSAVAHVAGIAALLKARDNTLTVNQIQSLLIDGAETGPLVGSGYNCNGVSEDAFPNNAFGHGRPNALNSVRLLEEAKKRKILERQ